MLTLITTDSAWPFGFGLKNYNPVMVWRKHRAPKQSLFGHLIVFHVAIEYNSVVHLTNDLDLVEIDI